MIQFHAANIWHRISRLSKGAQKRYVAVPFLGSRARQLLRLSRGDTLVVRFDPGTVKSGATNPREVLHYIQKGVEVHSTLNLHAKVFVFGRTAIVGSMNISETSAEDLIEAGIETTEPAIVRDARRFVLSLRGDVIEPQYAKKMIKYYKPSRSQRRRGSRPIVVRQSVIWAVPIVTATFDEEDWKQENAAQEDAKKRLKGKKAFSIDSFQAIGQPIMSRLRVGHRVLLVDERGKKTMVSPPGRVLSARRYKGRRGRKMMVCVAIRDSLRRVEKKRFLKKLGAHGKLLRTLGSPRIVRNQALAFKIGAAWPSSGVGRDA